MNIGLRVWSEGSLVESVDYVRCVQSVLARYRLDVAVVTYVAKMQLLEDFDGFGMTLFHVPDDHVAADQLIESKHRVSGLGGIRKAPHVPKVAGSIFSSLSAAA